MRSGMDSIIHVTPPPGGLAYPGGPGILWCAVARTLRHARVALRSGRRASCRASLRRRARRRGGFAQAGQRLRRRRWLVCGTPCIASPISTPHSVPHSIRSLKKPRCPMRNTRPASLPRPVPSDMSNLREHGAPERVGVVAVGHHHRRQRVAVLVRIAAEHLEAPAAHRAPRGFRVPRVPREHRRQAFLAQHRERLVQAVQQVGGRRRGKVALPVHREHLVPAPVRARQPRVLAGGDAPCRSPR